MSVTNTLEVEIKAKSTKATQSLDGLIAKLNEVNTALNGLNTEKLNQISQNLKGIKGVHLNGGGSRGSGGSGGNSNKEAIKEHNKAVNSYKNLLNAITRTNSGLINFRGSMLRMAATWGTFYAAMYPVIRLFKFFGNTVEDAMDYTETFNYFKVTMNKIGHDAGEEFKDSFYEQIASLNKKMSGFKLGQNGELFDTSDKSLGLDPTSMMKFQAQIGSITNSVGLLGKTSTSTQKALSMLAADYSSLRNIDLEESMQKFTSGLIGQSRALYSLGIDITNTNLKEYALAHGVTKSVSAMTQAEKMQLRLLAILDQSKVAWGDQANTITSVANQYRILKQQIANLGRTIGNLFLPIVKTVLPYLNAFVIAMRRIFNMLGMKLHGSNWLSDINDGISEGNFSGLNEEIEDTEDAINDATKAAKKFKQATMGLDELNIINPTETSGSGSGGSGGGGFDLSGDIDAALEEYEKVWDEAFKNMQNKAEEIANKFMSFVEARNWFGLGDWIGTSLTERLAAIPWNTVYQGAKDFGKGLAEFLNGLISPELFYQVGKTIAGSLNTALYFALDFLTTFDFLDLGKSIGNGINGFFENYDFAALAETLNAWVNGLEKAIIGAVTTIKWNEVLGGIADFLTHLDFDTIAFFVGTVAIKGIGKLLLSDMVKTKIAEKLATSIGTISLKSALKVTGGIALTVKGLTMVFDSMQEGKLLEGILGSLATTAGITVLTGGGLMVAVPTLIISFAAVSFSWLQKPDAETGHIGLIKLLEKIKLPGGEGVDFDGNEVKYKTNLKITLDEINWWFRWSLPQKVKEKSDEIKQFFQTAWGDFKLEVSFKFASIKDGFQTKWNEFTTWWDSALPKWFDKSVKPWFTKEKWSEVSDGVKTGLSEKWDSFTDWWRNTGFYSWWNDDVMPWFDKDKWTFEGIEKGLKKAWNNAITSIKSIWNTFADWMNENLKIHIDSKSIGGHKLWDAIDIQLATVPKFNIPKYAIGGFPEDGIFMANHNELVGQFSNGRTAVANNEQIVEGIRSGVASAVAQTLAPYLRDIAENTGATANNTNEIAKKPVQTMSDRSIAKANIRGQRSLGLQLRTT